MLQTKEITPPPQKKQNKTKQNKYKTRHDRELRGTEFREKEVTKRSN